MNQDPTELEHFNRQAHIWWDTEGEFGALHKINPLRIEFILQYQPITEQKILDIGCGGGILSEALAQAGAEVTGCLLATSDAADDLLCVALGCRRCIHTNLMIM